MEEGSGLNYSIESLFVFPQESVIDTLFSIHHNSAGISVDHRYIALILIEFLENLIFSAPGPAAR